MTTFRLVKLNPRHIDVEFNTGNEGVDEFWKDRYEYVEEEWAKVYIAESEEKIPMGYFSLSNGSLYTMIDGIHKRWPMVLLGQIGVDENFQRQGVGEFLINQAIEISYKIYEEGVIAIRGLYLEVDPDQKYLIEEWYPKYGFQKVQTSKNLVAMLLDFNTLSAQYI